MQQEILLEFKKRERRRRLTVPVEDFLRSQKRFKHLFTPDGEELIAQFQAEVDKRWEELKKKCGA